MASALKQKLDKVLHRGEYSEDHAAKETSTGAAPSPTISRTSEDKRHARKTSSSMRDFVRSASKHPCLISQSLPDLSTGSAKLEISASLCNITRTSLTAMDFRSVKNTSRKSCCQCSEHNSRALLKGVYAEVSASPTRCSGHSPKSGRSQRSVIRIQAIGGERY